MGGHQRRTLIVEVSGIVANQTIQIQTLGSFQAAVNGQAVDGLSRKTRAVLAYLASTPDHHSRVELFSLFCQEASDPAGALRWHLSRLRRKLHAEALLIDNRTVAFNHELASVDSLTFQSTLERLPRNSLPQTQLREVLEMYRGEYLSGLELRDAPEFEFWLIAERSRLNQLYERGLLANVDQLILVGKYLEAIAWTERLLRTNSLLEQAHSRLIWLYAQLNQRDKAIQQFERCRDILRKELAVEPSDDLLRLQEAFRGGSVPALELLRLTAAPVAPVQVEREVDFFGRDAEQEQLAQTWRDEWQTSGGVALIDGAAGDGKTRLAAEFTRRLPAHHLLQGHCHESSRHTPYHPWIEVLEAVLQRLPDAALESFDPYWLAQLSYLLPALMLRLPQETPRPDFSEMHISLAVVQLLRRLQLEVPRPLVILLDDLQWSDEASLHLFQFISSRSFADSNSPLLMVGLYRSEEAEENAALLTLIRDLTRSAKTLALTLRPLSAEAVQQLVAAKLPEQADVLHLSETLLRATGGNPLYLTEILSELREADVQANGQTSLPIPASLHELVKRRLGELPATQQQVLEAMAAVNDALPSDVFQAISGRSEEEVFNAIDAGLRWRLLRALEDEKPPRYAFQHDLIREAVWNQVNAMRRQRLHQRSAEKLIERGAAAAQIAFHWHGAGNLTQEAIYAAKAGREAAKMYSNAEARVHLQRAIEMTEDSADRVTWTVELGEVLFHLGEWDAAGQAFQDALETASTEELPAIEARAYLGLGQLARNRGFFPEAIQYLQKAQAIAERVADYKILSRSVGGLASTYWRQGESQTALDYQQQALAIAETHDDLSGLGMIHGGLGAVYANLDDFEKSLYHYNESLRIARQLDERGRIGKIITNIGIVYARQNDFERGAQHFLEGLRHDHELADLLGTATALNNLATVTRLRGAYRQSARFTQGALRIYLQLRNLRGAAICLGTLADIDIAQERYAQASAISQKVIALGQALKLRYETSYWFLRDAQCLGGQQSYGEALLRCREALQLAQEVTRDEVLFPATVYEIELRARAGIISAADACDELRTLEETRQQDSERALILDTIWQLDPSQEAACEEAAALYRALYEKSPGIQYLQRYQALSGKTLPQTPLDLEVPDFVLAEQSDLSQMLTQVDALMAQLM